MKPEGNPVHEVGQELSLRICTRVYWFIYHSPQRLAHCTSFYCTLIFRSPIEERSTTVHHCLRGPAAVSSQHKVGHQGDVPWKRREPGESESQDLTLSHFVHMVFRCAYWNLLTYIDFSLESPTCLQNLFNTKSRPLLRVETIEKLDRKRFTGQRPRNAKDRSDLLLGLFLTGFCGK